MTASRSSAPDDGLPARAVVAQRRPVALLAVALAGATVVAGTVPAGAAASGGAPSGELARVVVSSATTGAAGASAAAAAVVAAGGRVLDALPLVGGVAAELPEGAVLAPGLQVAPDRPVQVAAADAAVAPVDGPAATVRETLGLGAPDGEGAGVTVAVVDTGVADSADLAGRVTTVDVSGSGEGDGYGHGTFVAGLVAGDGAASAGRYAGVAPGAEVLSVRVADDEGRTDLVTVLRGLEAARAQGADVVNLSLSSYSPLPWQLDPLTRALGALWQSGTVVVVPAGNDGPAEGTVTSPGVHPWLITVGALDEAGTGERGDDAVAPFSARGPAPQDVAKPELVAPGRSVVSLRAPGSAIDAAYGPAAAVGDHYFKGSGSSFSTAVTAGAAAALLGERDLTPDQVKALLVGTAYTADGLAEPTAAGAGGLDLAAALAAPAPDADAPEQLRGQGKLRRDLGPPGQPGEWNSLVRALLDGDAAAAASSWSRLSPEAKAWVASSWSGLPAGLRAELVAVWEGRNWGQLSPEEWAALDWAGRNWAASSWSGRNWGTSSWSGRNWGGRNWGGRNWGGRNWAEVMADEDWLAGWDLPGWQGRNWAGRNWAGRNWAASSWAGRNWAGRNWAGRNWAGRNWAASSWAASSWAAAWGT